MPSGPRWGTSSPRRVDSNVEYVTAVQWPSPRGLARAGATKKAATPMVMIPLMVGMVRGKEEPCGSEVGNRLM